MMPICGEDISYKVPSDGCSETVSKIYAAAGGCDLQSNFESLKSNGRSDDLTKLKSLSTSDNGYYSKSNSDSNASASGNSLNLCLEFVPVLYDDDRKELYEVTKCTNDSTNTRTMTRKPKKLNESCSMSIKPTLCEYTKCPKDGKDALTKLESLKSKCPSDDLTKMNSICEYFQSLKLNGASDDKGCCYQELDVHLASIEIGKLFGSYLNDE